MPTVEKRSDFSTSVLSEAESDRDESIEVAGTMNIWITWVTISKIRIKILAELYTATWTGPDTAERMNESAFE